MLSNLSIILLSSWKRDTTLEDDDFLNLDDFSGVAGACCTGARGAAESVAKDRWLRYFDILLTIQTLAWVFKTKYSQG